VADSGQSLWLQAAERLTEVSDPIWAARWGALALTWTASSCFVAEAATLAEATRQLDFVKGPLVQDVVGVGSIVNISSLRGGCVSVDGEIMFLLGGSVDRSVGSSQLQVLRRL
jgi:hypothetical protein